MELLLQGVLTLVGAAIGAGFALDRYRNERAFDRRMDWYEQFLAAARGLNVAVSRLEATIVTERPDGATREEHVAAALRMSDLIAAGNLYADDALIQVLSAHTRQLVQLQRVMNPGDPIEIQQHVAACRALQQVLGEMQLDVGEYGRQHLYETRWQRLRRWWFTRASRRRRPK